MKISEEQALSMVGQTIYMVWGHVHVNRFVTPETERLEFYSRSQLIKNGDSLSGSYGSYFTTPEEADTLASEILAGKHPSLVSQAREYDYECDLMDESMGICDRGLGTYDDPNEDDYPCDIYENEE